MLRSSVNVFVIHTSKLSIPIKVKSAKDHDPSFRLTENASKELHNSKTTKSPQRVPHMPSRVNIKQIISEDDDCDKSNHNDDERACGNFDDSHSEAEPVGKATRTLLGKSPAMTVFHEKLQNYDGFQYSAEDWNAFENKACTENPDLHKQWGTMCMQLLYGAFCSQLATSLMDYLYGQTSQPKVSTLCLYMALLGQTPGSDRELIGQTPGSDRERIILNTFSKVQEITDVFDAISAQYIIVGLSATSQWRKALDVLEMAKLTTQPGSAYYSPIVRAALRDDVELAFQLLDQIGSKGIQPQGKVLEQVLQLCRDAGNHSILKRYLSLMWRFSWQLSRDLAQEVELYFSKTPNHKWTCKWTMVDTVKGTCHACKSDMNRIEVASSDFEGLQREFLERALVGSNIYLKSNPQEVERFKDFVMENAPFDVVLDALNIAYRRSGGTAAKSKQLREIVHYYAREKHMKVLVIGRAHMNNWSPGDMAYISKNAKTFYTDNISSDDPFCLYAALYSGKDTLFVSRDFMRDHKFNLGLHWKDIFERWQKSRQIVNFLFTETGVSIGMPSQFDCGPVEDAQGWHIPYNDGTARLGSSCQTVLCLRYKGERAASSATRTRK